MADMEALLRQHQLPLCSLEDFTPLAEFDVLGFTLQYDLCYTNVLAMLDLAGIPLAAAERDRRPSAGDRRRPLRGQPRADGPLHRPVRPRRRRRGLAGGVRPVAGAEDAGPGARRRRWSRWPAGCPMPTCRNATSRNTAADGRQASVAAAATPACRSGSSRPWSPTWSTIRCPPPRSCRTSSASRTASRWRSCAAAPGDAASARARRPSGRSASARSRRSSPRPSRRIATRATTRSRCLGLSTGDYPQIEELLRRLQETFRPLDVSVSLPSLRVNQQLALLGDLLNTDRRDGLTLAPEAARDAMRRRIGKDISNDDLYEGCRRAMANGFSRVKLYFMCGLPGEEQADLDGILDMAETISRLGKECGGRFATVWPTWPTSCPSRRRPSNGTPCSGGNISPRPTSTCGGGEDSAASRSAATRSSRACWKACSRGATAAWPRPSSWPFAAAPASTPGTSSFAPTSGGRPWPTRASTWSRSCIVRIAADAVLPWDHVGIRQGREYLEREIRDWGFRDLKPRIASGGREHLPRPTPAGCHVRREMEKTWKRTTWHRNSRRHPPDRNSKLRWYQYRLRSLLLVVTPGLPPPGLARR